MKALPWPVGRYRRILPPLTTNQNAGFVTVPSEKKNSKYLRFTVKIIFSSIYLNEKTVFIAYQLRIQTKSVVRWLGYCTCGKYDFFLRR